MAISRDGRDQSLALHRVISEKDPDLKNPFTPEEATNAVQGGWKAMKQKERIAKEISLKGSISMEKKPRVVRLVENSHYYILLIGEKKKMGTDQWPPRNITICKEELPALKELFAAV